MAKLEVGEFERCSCIAKSHYHGICYVGKIGFVLFHLVSELALRALAELKLCSFVCIVQLHGQNSFGRSSITCQL